MEVYAPNACLFSTNSVKLQINPSKINKKTGTKIIRDKTESILAIPFHPEVTDQNQGLPVLDYFLENMVPKSIVQSVTAQSAFIEVANFKCLC